MSEFYWLQLFAEGSDGEGTGGTAPDAGEELRALGVPEEKIRKRAGRMAPRQQAAADAPQAQAAQETARQEQDAAAQTETIPKRMTWEEIMEDPEYNGRMQQVVRDRLRESRGAQDNLRTLEPALELLADRYHLDAGNLDAAALAKAITEDSLFYEQRAEELGVSPDMARRMDQMERFERRQREMQEDMARHRWSTSGAWCSRRRPCASWCRTSTCGGSWKTQRLRG